MLSMVLQKLYDVLHRPGTILGCAMHTHRRISKLCAGFVLKIPNQWDPSLASTEMAAKLQGRKRISVATRQNGTVK